MDHTLCSPVTRSSKKNHTKWYKYHKSMHKCHTESSEISALESEVGAFFCPLWSCFSAMGKRGNAPCHFPVWTNEMVIFYFFKTKKLNPSIFFVGKLRGLREKLGEINDNGTWQKHQKYIKISLSCFLGSFFFVALPSSHFTQFTSKVPSTSKNNCPAQNYAKFMHIVHNQLMLFWAPIYKVFFCMEFSQVESSPQNDCTFIPLIVLSRQ